MLNAEQAVPDLAAVADYRQQAREFLSKSREYLAEDDLHQASEKGWGAACWMAKAAATVQGWEYSTHEHFSSVMENARILTGDARLPGLRGIANDLHGNFYKRNFLLNATAIQVDLDHVAELLDILEPLTGTHSQANTE